MAEITLFVSLAAIACIVMMARHYRREFSRADIEAPKAASIKPLWPFPWRLFRRYPATAPENLDAAINADYAAVFQTERGARVLADMMTEAELFNSTLSKHRADRDMLDGKRELMMTVFERAGFSAGALPAAMISDDLRKAIKEADRDDPTEPAEPLFSVRDPDDAIITDGD